MPILRLALPSLWNRRGTAALTVVTIAISVALLLGVQKLRTEAKASFASTISGVDLIVGARSGPVNLLLYSIFRMGDATQNVSRESYRKIAAHPDVAWTVPLTLGDSHRGYRVLGTNASYFERYRYGRMRELSFRAGRAFERLHDAVLGADVADSLAYSVGDSIVVAHGIGETSFVRHVNEPFTVVGILERTGTPVDRTVHVSLEAIDAIHDAQQTPASITAFLVGLRSRLATLQMQRAINEYRGEALLAILPGVALQQLWDLVGVAERALMIVAAFVVLTGLLGMLSAILTSLNERRREMAILRSVGARPWQIFLLFVSEAAILACTGVLLGIVLIYALIFFAQPLIASRLGMFIALERLTRYDLGLLALIVGAALLMSALPAWRAYRHSLADGLTIRL